MERMAPIAFQSKCMVPIELSPVGISTRRIPFQTSSRAASSFCTWHKQTAWFRDRRKRARSCANVSNPLKVTEYRGSPHQNVHAIYS